MKLSYDDAMSFINKQEPKFLSHAYNCSGYVCPSCGYGSDPGEPGLTFNSETGMYLCPNCNSQADIVQLMKVLIKKTMPADEEVVLATEEHAKVISALCNEYDIEIDDSLDDFFKERQSQMIYSEYIRKCHSNVFQTDYFQTRGIGEDLVEKFMLGYDDCYDDGASTWPAVILPTSEITYEARNLEVELDSSREKKRYRKHGNTVIFNGAALNDTTSTPIFVCAGIFDALSILECGGQAIALQTSFSPFLFIRTIEKSIPTAPLILVLSKEMNEIISDKLKQKLISHITCTEIFGNCMDINARLISDREGLESEVKKAISSASSLPDPIEAAREEYINSSAGRSWPTILRQIQREAEFPRLKMGFDEIDSALDGGLYPGLYTIGAISSLGKTTFLVQVADNLARQGQDVLFFSLEQSKKELVCKSLSRLTYQYCLDNNCPTSYAKTGLGISDGRRWKNYSPDELTVMQKCVKEYQSFADHIFYYEGVGNISVQDIRDKVALHIGITKNPHPIVMIDYLQVLAVPENERRSTDKQFVDYNITALCQLAREFEITIFCISALNRQSYTDKISMAAFKESGKIEYGSDVLMGLQFYGVDEKDFNLEKEKEKCPRDVELCILKNRNVKPRSTGIRLLYDARFNHFVCRDEMMKLVERFKSGRRYLDKKET